MSVEIWSISLTQNGLGGCALDADMNRREFAAEWPNTRWHGVRTVDTAAVLRIVAKTFESLLDGHEPPIAIAFSSPNEETAVFVDGCHKAVSPVFLDNPLPMPKSAIPERFAANEVTASAFRDSVIRRIQQNDPTFGMHCAFGLWSIGSLVMHALTGHARCACRPRGMLHNIYDYDDDSKQRLFQAMGIDESLCDTRMRAGAVAARISPQVAQYLNAEDIPGLAALSGIPVYDMGCSDGAFAYAVGANPVSCAVSIGWDVRANWVAGYFALATYEIQIVDKNAEESSNTSDAIPKEMTADEWTKLFHSRCPLHTQPGPGKNRMTYGWSRPRCDASVMHSAVSSILDDGSLPFDTLKKAPLGSAGLHFFCANNGWRIAGLNAAHEPVHLARALFEGMCYELREWLETINPDGANPVRICVEKPWPAECAQWAADILGECIYALDDETLHLTAFGSALALMRSFDLQELKAPHIEAILLEPTERSAHYQTQFAIHGLLKEN